MTGVAERLGGGLKEPRPCKRGKVAFALATISVGLFFVTCTPTDEEQDQDEQNPLLPGSQLQYYLGYSYDVVNSSYVNRSDVKISYPVLDQKRMISDGLVVSEQIPGQQDFQVSVGTSIARFYNDRNASVGLNVNSGNGITSAVTGALFSGKFGAEFSVSLNENRIDTNSYLRGRTYRYTQDHYINGATTPTLLEYLTDGFASDLETRTASQILDRYGTHVFVRYYKGGALEFNYVYNGKSLTTDNQMRAALQASYAVISGDASGNTNAGSIELERNSIFHSIITPTAERQ